MRRGGLTVEGERRALPPGSAEALATGPRLAAIEAKLDRILAGGVAAAGSPPDPLVTAAVDELLDFGV